MNGEGGVNGEDVMRSPVEPGVAARTKTMGEEVVGEEVVGEEVVGEEVVNRAEDGRAGGRGRVVVAVVLALALAGVAVLVLIGPDREPGDPGSSEARAGQEDPVVSGSLGQAAAATSTLPGGSPVVRDERDTVLRPDGIGQVDFGADPETAIAAISAGFGPPTEPLEWRPLCGFTDSSGRAVEVGYATWGALTLQFDRFEGPDRFSGWTLTALEVESTPVGPRDFATPDGISIATTVAEVQALHPEAAFQYSEQFNEHRALLSFDGGDVQVSALVPDVGGLIVNLSAGLLSCA